MNKTESDQGFSRDEEAAVGMVTSLGRGSCFGEAILRNLQYETRLVFVFDLLLSVIQSEL